MVKPKKGTELRGSQKTRSPARSSAAKQDGSKQVTSGNEGENELAALQLKKRNLQGDRRAYEKETQEEIRRQRGLIAQLESERDEILTCLKRASSRISQTKENKVSGKLKSLLDKADNIDKEIEKEKQKQSEIEIKIKEMEKKIAEERKSDTPIDDPTTNIKRLTDHVAQMNSKFSRLLIINSNLLNDIEVMFCERAKFHLLHRRLQKELEETRRESETVMDDANEAYQSREEAQARIARAWEQQENDTEQYNVELKEMKRELDHVGSLSTFLVQKTKERESDKQLLKSIKKKEAMERERKIEHKVLMNKYEEAMQKINDIIETSAKKNNFNRQTGRNRIDIRLEGTNEDEKKLTWELDVKRKSVSLNTYSKEAAGESDADRKKSRIPEHRRRSSILATALEDQERQQGMNTKSLEHQVIQEGKKTVDFDAQLFYDVFMKREDENFALFNFVTEQTNEIENTENYIAQLKIRIEFQKSEIHTINQEQDNMKINLEQNLKEIAKAADKLQEEGDRSEKNLNQLKTGIDSLAKKLELNTEDFSQFLGWSEGVTNHNILTYLGMIEQRVSELLAARSFLQYKNAERMEKSQGSIQHYLGNSLSKFSTQFEIQPPSACLNFDSDEDEMNEKDIRPLSKNELQKKALKALSTVEDGNSL
ncbi:coiled-coil domain-containing protein 63 [Callorhinchus milii]|nr:coiled-coil domain-containing protein 63 [Callorhinchus milii]